MEHILIFLILWEVIIMAKKETQTAAPAIQTAEELEAKIRTMKEAQKKFAS